ncbi:hypothetical protein FS837_005316 [Tulasnella sp. UAMH 9824]|nr:hypothetical protein FS837_005316 [Tulasnella sp. UAMH 9824]
MSDDIQNLATFAAITIAPIAVAAVYAAIPRHPPLQVVPRAGRQLNTPVAIIPPSGASRPQASYTQQAHPPQANHRVHLEDPFAALPPPSPPPNYHEHPQDPRIDGTVPSYGNTGSPRARTVDVVPSPNRNPPQENADFDEGVEGGHV